MPQYTPQPRSYRSLHLALFAASIMWVIASNTLAALAARGFSVRFHLGDERLLLNGLFLLFLLVVGFVVLEGIGNRSTPLRQTLELPKRPSSRAEWASGAAIGWGIIVCSVFTMFLAGALHVRLWFAPRSLWLALLNLVTVALFALAAEVGFRGYAYRRLIQAIGTGWATVVLSLVYGLISTANQSSTYLSTFVAMLLGLLLCLAWQRTHGLWLGWGLHFSWIASLGVLFGLPVGGFDNLSTIVQSRAVGGSWLTGDLVTAEGTLLMPLLLLGAIPVLYRVSRDWAWNYTHPPIEAAGYPMDVAPPPAHVAMENKPAGSPALVQILPSTPQTRSVEPETH